MNEIIETVSAMSASTGDKLASPSPLCCSYGHQETAADAARPNG